MTGMLFYYYFPQIIAWDQIASSTSHIWTMGYVFDILCLMVFKTGPQNYLKPEMINVSYASGWVWYVTYLYSNLCISLSLFCRLIPLLLVRVLGVWKGPRSLTAWLWPTLPLQSLITTVPECTHNSLSELGLIRPWASQKLWDVLWS